MELLLNRKEKNGKEWMIFLVAGILMSGYLLKYISVSIGEMPMMDYWLGSAAYLERVLNEPIQLKYIIQIPHALHWNPFYSLCDYVFIHLFKCDNRAYIYCGVAFAIVSIVLLLYVYWKYFKQNNKLADFCGCLICTLPIINLNQWEIFTLYCNFQFMFRVLLYLWLFYCIDKYAHEGDDRKTWKKAILYGICGMFIILLVSQAYFPGFVAGIMGILGLDLILYRNKVAIKRYVLLISFYLSGIIIYLLTLTPSEKIAGSKGDFFKTFAEYGKGILLMLGSTVVPATKQTENMTNCYIIGIGILMVTCVGLIIYFKIKLYQVTYFPIACLIYAFVSIVVIEMGRISVFGLESLTSSRYVVETTIGLIGIAQIYWVFLCKNSKRWIGRGVAGSILVSMLVLLCWANNTEMKMGPNRKAYNQNMVELASNIDDVSDEELAVFQAPAQDVRDGIAVMKKYKLSIWRE